VSASCRAARARTATNTPASLNHRSRIAGRWPPPRSQGQQDSTPINGDCSSYRDGGARDGQREGKSCAWGCLPQLPIAASPKSLHWRVSQSKIIAVNWLTLYYFLLPACPSLIAVGPNRGFLRPSPSASDYRAKSRTRRGAPDRMGTRQAPRRHRNAARPVPGKRAELCAWCGPNWLCLKRTT
jgi:hypothetical protein